MKDLHKLTGVPYGTAQKSPKSPMRLLTKLSLKQKTKQKQKNRIFSLELGRSLPKRLIWQVAVPFAKNPTLPQKTLSCSWSAFRSAFFGKMWFLNNASVVPGVVWPTKSKKSFIAKMKAFKALSLSLGNLKTQFLVEKLQKLNSSYFSSQTHGSVWKMASNLECFKQSFFLKLGFVPTFPMAKHILRSKVEVFQKPNDENRFLYPGDFHLFKLNSEFFAQIFSLGPLISKKPKCATLPFLWLSNSFYNPTAKNPKKKKFVRSNRITL